jgi:SAM-dependent MidA family methyltransferase
MDHRQEGSDPELVARIRDEILSAPDRRVPFARFMARALTEQGLGYYATSRERPTRGGDFLTAPELHPFFGRLVGRQLDEVWKRLEEPASFVVREYGAGRGTLERTVRAGLSADGSPLAGALDWEPVDIGTHAPGAAGAPVVGAVLANEFLDALPVHRVVMRGGALQERYVAWRYGWFTEEEGPPSTPRLEALLELDGVVLAEGQAADVGLAAVEWSERLGPQLVRGIALVIDYGHPASELYGPKRMAGTLMTYRNHQVGDDPFAYVGRQDLTAHVDVTAVDRAVRASGLLAMGQTTQAQFVTSLGLGGLLDALGHDPSTDAQAYLLARSSVTRLLDPRYLGGFRVLAWGRGIAAEAPLRGFAGQVR